MSDKKKYSKLLIIYNNAKNINYSKMKLKQ